MESSEYLRVGKIVGTHGLQGEVRVLSDTDFPDDRFRSGKKLFLNHPSFVEPILLTVKKSRPHKNVFIIKFLEWDSIDIAESYRDGNLVVLREDIPPIEAEDEFYCYEIVGCHIITTDGEQKGQVVEVLKYPANDIWVCHHNGKEWLLPFIKDVVKEVDVEGRLIRIQWMEGMD